MVVDCKSPLSMPGRIGTGVIGIGIT